MNSLAGTIVDAQPRYTTSKFAATWSRNLQTITASFLFLFVLVQPLSIAASHIAYAGAALAWVLHLLTTHGRTLKRSPLDLVILLYLALCTLSTFFSPLPLSSWEGMRKVALIFLVLVVAHNVPNLRRAKQLLAGLFVSSLVAFGWAGWNYIDGVGLRIHNPQPGTAFYRAGIRDNDVILRVDGKDVKSPREFLDVVHSEGPGKAMQLRVVHGGGIEIMKDAVPVAVPIDDASKLKNAESLGMQIQTDRPGRARAFYSHYVTYAAVLQMLGCLVFGLGLSHYRRSPVSGAVLALLFIAFGIALAMTLTRASWLALAFGCAVELWFCLGKLGKAIVLPAILIAAVGATSVVMHHWRGTGIIDRSDPGTDYRILMWEDGLKLIEAHPLFGVGMNVVRDEPSKFDLRAFKKYGMESHFHSTPIELGVELGLLVLVAWGALMAVYCLLLVRLVDQTRNATDPFPHGLSLGILGATAGFLATSLVHYDFGDSVVVFLVWFLMGLALALNHLLGRSTQLAPRPDAT